MIENMEPVLKSRKFEHGGSERGVVLIDRLSKLEDEILFLIVSLLTTKEVARTSILSKRWEHLWRRLPVLHFEDYRTMERMGGRDKPFGHQKSRFVTHVNHVLKNRLSSPIDELKVAFDLDDSYKSHIDQWLTCALENNFKKLDLNFEPSGSEWKKYEWLNIANKQRVSYTLPPIQSHNQVASLTSLHLRNVNVRSGAIGMFLRSCPLLVALCVARSDFLTSIKAVGFSLRLERLEIFYCTNMKRVDISAPKLLSLKYDGKPIKLKIRDASLLSEVHIGGMEQLSIHPTYDSISQYFPKLKYLSLRMSIIEEFNLEPSRIAAFTSLKHLQLYVYSVDYNQTLLGWTSLIEACPVLEILTIELFMIDNDFSKEIVDNELSTVECDGRALKCLKTLELLGYIGRKIDLELAYYVLENAVNLEQVIVDNKARHMPHKIKGAKRRLRKLKTKMKPKGVSLIIRN